MASLQLNKLSSCTKSAFFGLHYQQYKWIWFQGQGLALATVGLRLGLTALHKLSTGRPPFFNTRTVRITMSGGSLPWRRILSAWIPRRPTRDSLEFVWITQWYMGKECPCCDNMVAAAAASPRLSWLGLVSCRPGQTSPAGQTYTFACFQLYHPLPAVLLFERETHTLMQKTQWTEAIVK